MKINFDMDINVSDWAEAIGYTVVGDKVVSKNVFLLSDFEECISDYISEAIECGTNSGVVVERFFANDDEQHGLRDMLEECERVETVPSVVEEIIDYSSLQREEQLALIVDGADAVFLPGKIHGCEDQLYIIYHNTDANGGNGSFEIEILDYERVLKLAEEKDMCAEVFFERLSDMFQGEWCYCNSDSEDYWNFVEDFFNADFVFGRDGGATEEYEFIVNWARERKQQCPESDEITEDELEKALEKQRRFVAWCGGYDRIKECCIEYNDNNQKIIEAYRKKHGRAYLGNINFHGDVAEQVRNCRISPLYEYTGGQVQNFACDFIVPNNDHLLTELIRIQSVVHFYYKPVVEAIYKRINELDGLVLLWT